MRQVSTVKWTETDHFSNGQNQVVKSSQITNYSLLLRQNYTALWLHLTREVPRHPFFFFFLILVEFGCPGSVFTLRITEMWSYFDHNFNKGLLWKLSLISFLFFFWYHSFSQILRDLMREGQHWLGQKEANGTLEKLCGPGVNLRWKHCHPLLKAPIEH